MREWIFQKKSIYHFVSENSWERYLFSSFFIPNTFFGEQEILNAIMNRGKQFSELEYINALQLLHRSSPGTSQEVLHSHLQRLSEILGDIGVTV